MKVSRIFRCTHNTKHYIINTLTHKTCTYLECLRYTSAFPRYKEVSRGRYRVFPSIHRSSPYTEYTIISSALSQWVGILDTKKPNTHRAIDSDEMPIHQSEQTQQGWPLSPLMHIVEWVRGLPSSQLVRDGQLCLRRVLRVMCDGFRAARVLVCPTKRAERKSPNSTNALHRAPEAFHLCCWSIVLCLSQKSRITSFFAICTTGKKGALNKYCGHRLMAYAYAYINIYVFMLGYVEHCKLDQTDQRRIAGHPCRWCWWWWRIGRQLVFWPRKFLFYVYFVGFA